MSSSVPVSPHPPGKNSAPCGSTLAHAKSPPVPDFIDDPEWRRAYRAGERAALERAYRAYVRPIERYLRSLARFYGSPELGQSSAVADFLQEVFTRAFSTSARRNYDESRAFGAYVTTIARNCFVDTLRVRAMVVT